MTGRRFRRLASAPMDFTEWWLGRLGAGLEQRLATSRPAKPGRVSCACSGWPHSPFCPRSRSRKPKKVTMKHTLGTRLSDARYRATRPLRTATGRVGNWRRRRFAETGKGYVAERATRGVRSSLPVYRDRINPATGRPRADDAEIYRRRDAALAALRERRITPSPNVRAQDYAPQRRSR